MLFLRVLLFSAPIPDFVMVKIGDMVLTPSKEVKYLRVWLETSLCWSRQMSSSTARVYRSLRSFYFLRGSLDYCAAVLSSLDVRTSSMPKVSLNACIRFIADVPRYALVSTYRLRLGFLSSNNRRFYLALVLFFKVTVMRFPPKLVYTLGLQPETANKRGRSAKSWRFRLPLIRHRSFVHSFSHSSISA